MRCRRCGGAIVAFLILLGFTVSASAHPFPQHDERYYPSLEATKAQGPARLGPTRVRTGRPPGPARRGRSSRTD